jgi:hypothetical protein
MNVSILKHTSRGWVLFTTSPANKIETQLFLDDLTTYLAAQKFANEIIKQKGGRSWQNQKQLLING